MHVLYYYVTFMSDQTTLGEEYTNVRPFNEVDYDNEFTPLTKKRRTTFLLMSLMPFLVLKLKQKLRVYQQMNPDNQWIKYIPEVDSIADGIQ